MKKCDFRAVQRTALCRSRRELSNAYLLAKSGFDTAENEPCQVAPIEQCSRAGVTVLNPIQYPFEFCVPLLSPIVPPPEDPALEDYDFAEPILVRPY